MPVLYEEDKARRLKGQEYSDFIATATMSAGGDGTKKITPGKIGTTSLGKGGLLDSVAQNHIEELNIEKEKQLLASKHIIQEYTLYADGKIKEALSRYNFNYKRNDEKMQLEQRMLDNMNVMKQFGYSDTEINRLIYGEYFGLEKLFEIQDKANNIKGSGLKKSIKTVSEISKDKKQLEKTLRHILQARIDYVNKTTSLMAQMMQRNYSILGLTEKEANVYISALKSEDNESVKTAGKIKDIIKKNAEKFMINDGTGIDLRSMGFGCIFGPIEGYNMNFVGTEKKTNKDGMLQMLQKAIHYQAVVVGHGDSKKREDSDNNYWSCQPVKTLKAGPFDNMDDIIRQLIKEGFKKILIMDCNPGSHQLADDILNTPNIIINYSNFSNYVESVDDVSDNPEIKYINEIEEDLVSIASEHGISYYDDEYLEECYNWYLSINSDNTNIISEGEITSALADFFKRAIGVILRLIKRILDFFKLFIDKIKELFYGTKQKPKNANIELPEKIECSLTDVSEKKIVNVSGNKISDIDAAVQKVNKSTAKAIKTLKDRQTKSMDEIKKDIERLRNMDIKNITNSNNIKEESVDFNDFSFLDSILNEFNVGNGEEAEPFNATEDEENNDNSSNTPTQTSDTSDTPATSTDTAPASNTPDSSTPDTTDSEETSATDGLDTGEIDFTDDDTGEDTPTDDTGDNTSEVDYTLNDPEGEGEQNSEGDEGDTPQNDEGEVDFTDDGGEGSPEGQDDDMGGDDGMDMDGDNPPSDDPYTGLKDIERELFDNLTDEQKNIKIKELKQNYADLHERCDGIIEIITNTTPSDESTARVFNYIQKTLIDLQDTVKDYLAYTFNTKTYLENDAQFKSYLVILNTIKNILEELNIAN